MGGRWGGGGSRQAFGWTGLCFYTSRMSIPMPMHILHTAYKCAHADDENHDHDHDHYHHLQAHTTARTCARTYTCVGLQLEQENYQYGCQDLCCLSPACQEVHTCTHAHMYSCMHASWHSRAHSRTHMCPTMNARMHTCRQGSHRIQFADKHVSAHVIARMRVKLSFAKQATNAPIYPFGCPPGH